MDRWRGKVAVVTGASSGIGEATAEALVEKGLKVIGLARRIDRMIQLQDKLVGRDGSFYPIRCDLRHEPDILRAFVWAKSNFGGVDVLVNNAGVSTSDKIIDGPTESFRKILDVNNIAVAVCTREAIRSMRERNVPGHVININSMFGHNATLAIHPNCLYSPSKFALTAMCEIMKREVQKDNLDIKVTSVSPGLVKTEIAETVGRSYVFDQLPYLDAKDIAESIVYVLSTPPHVLVTELSVEPMTKKST